MLGSKSKSDARSTRGTAKSHNDTTLIAAGTEVQGRITFRGTLQVEGCIEGDVVAADDAGDETQVWIQNQGEVNGDICAPVVIVNSTVRGNVYSSSRVELAANAVVAGDIHYQVIEMVKGSQITGGMVYAGAEPVAPTAAEADDSECGLLESEA